MPLTITFQERQVGVFTVFPAGSLDSNTSHLLEARLRVILASSPKVVVLDLKDLSYISSAGIRVIVAAMKAMRQAGGSIALTNLQPQIRKVLDIIKALPSLNIFESVQELDAYLDDIQKAVTGKED